MRALFSVRVRPVALLLTFIFVIALTVTVFAASATVYISTGQTSVRSSAITSNYGASYDGYNYSSSGHPLYIDLQYSDGTGWQTERTSLMAIGSGAYGSSSRSGALLWRVQLNCMYWYSDCIGRGTVSN